MYIRCLLFTPNDKETFLLLQDIVWSVLYAGSVHSVLFEVVCVHCLGRRKEKRSISDLNMALLC